VFANCRRKLSDATTVSGHHKVREDGIFRFGHSRDDPALPQIRMMTAAPGPLGMPPATDTVSGEKADDPLYVPVIRRVASCLGKRGLPYVGDCKMCAVATRRYIVSDEVGGHYLCPLPRTGVAAEDIGRWADRGTERDGEGSPEKVTVRNEKGEEVLIAKGYVLRRSQKEIFGENEEKVREEEGGEEEGGGGGGERRERVFVVKSVNYAKQTEKGLEKRLKNAEEKLRALTPPRGRGKRQITDETELREKAEAILKKHRVAGLLRYEYERETEQRTKYVGRGRGSANREKETVVTVRYQITAVTEDADSIKKEKERAGWRAYVTDIPKEGLSLSDAVRCHRREYRVESIFRRLRSRLNASPPYVRRDDQIRGMTCPADPRSESSHADGICCPPFAEKRQCGTRRTAPRKPEKGDRQADDGTASESLLRYLSDCHKDRGRQGDTPSDTSFRSAEGNPGESGAEAISL